MHRTLDDFVRYCTRPVAQLKAPVSEEHVNARRLNERGITFCIVQWSCVKKDSMTDWLDGGYRTKREENEAEIWREQNGICSLCNAYIRMIFPFAENCVQGLQRVPSRAVPGLTNLTKSESTRIDLGTSSDLEH